MLLAGKSTRARARSLTVICFIGLAAVLVPADSAHAAPSGSGTEVRVEEVTVTGHGGITLNGAVFTPTAEGPPWPGAVIVHDAGPRGWQEYRRIAEDLARAGTATLVYDKRTAGYSMLERDFGVLAEDAVAGVSLLRSRPGVDPARVGLVGFSEGGWVAPLAASQSSDVAYLVTVGASGVSPARAQAWSYQRWLDHAGVTGSLCRAVSTIGIRLFVDAGAFPEAHHDPVPILLDVDQPVLAVWGVLDRQVPPIESAAIFRDALAAGGNNSTTIRLLEGAEHSMFRTDDGGFTAREEYVDGYPGLLTSWIAGLQDGPPASRADTLPVPSQPSTVLAPVQGWESLPVQLAVMAMVVLLLVVPPLVNAIRRPHTVGRRRRPPTVGRGPALLLTTSALVVMLGLVAYLGFLASNGAEVVGPVVAGRPVVWLVLQLLALVAVVSAVAIAVGWYWSRSADRNRRWAHTGTLALAGTLFTAWAGYWGLLLP